MSLTIRHARSDEVASAAGLLNEHSRRLYGTGDTTAAELAEDWRSSEIAFPDDVLVAEHDGKLVGYADVLVHGENAWLDVRGTDPAAYDALLAAIAERASAKPVAHVRGWADERDEPLHDAYERAGFRPFRHSFRMEIDLGGDVSESSWPPGFTVRPFRTGDERTFHEVHMESFADTWGFTHDPYEHWAHWFVGERFQPEHWFLVEREGDVAAIAICRISETEPDVGWVRVLGVRPAYRRHGLALALLQHVFRHFAGHGRKKVGLGVDAENPTGAVRLYERAGMHVARKELRYEKVRR